MATGAGPAGLTAAGPAGPEAAAARSPGPPAGPAAFLGLPAAFSDGGKGGGGGRALTFAGQTPQNRGGGGAATPRAPRPPLARIPRTKFVRFLTVFSLPVGTFYYL